ncbi:hypothetical protein IMZ08_19310 [Bacillus luteolus]|uniref:Uncharacterized protein n=1 Tax=Litchfieldia luteola TaxID=682179 RepID=A0ABR9QNV4_9BACI|nr:hypothetical protein [Cytobacillus luteolus]MBE4910190.1 hypothetical protein [Cytobacillus luteolus]MBP1942241.1 hypothetical protein [Cytobacillus luteolus]
MALIKAKVKIKGTRALIFNNFNNDCIPLQKREKEGVAGNNPNEWKKTFLVTAEKQLYLDSRYIFACIRSGGKYTQKGRGTFEPDISASLQVLSEKLLINRYLPNENEISTDDKEPVYIDIRPVSRRGAKNIRYRLATAVGWESEFVIAWENTLISPEQMETICNDAGTFAGFGDGRKIGFGRFEITDFQLINLREAHYA